MYLQSDKYIWLQALQLFCEHDELTKVFYVEESNHVCLPYLVVHCLVLYLVLI